MSNMSRGRKLPEPEKGGTPKRITTKNPPGGDQTPGAKAEREKLEKYEGKKKMIKKPGPHNTDRIPAK